MKNSLLSLLLRGALALGLAVAAAPTSSWAQEEDDELDELLGPSKPTGGSDVGSERRDVEAEADAELTRKERVELGEAKRRVIKTLVPKDFLKIGRVEAMPFVGLVTNDPFLRRILFGAGVGYHVTEVFGVELQGAYSPNFGNGDWKPVTRQIYEINQVSPQLSRLTYFATVNTMFSPFYGKSATLGRSTINFDIFGVFGAGIAGTIDDLEITGKTEDERALATQNQIHPALSFGGGLRVAFNRTVALRFEARSLSYINTIESTQLELKNNLALQLGASFFFGGRSQ